MQNLRTYVCPAGKYNGVGHFGCFRESFPDGITMGQAQEMLSQDLAGAERAVNGCPATAPINQAQFDALVSFVLTWAKAPLTRLTLPQADQPVATWLLQLPSLARWVLADGKAFRSVRRRKAEAALFKMGQLRRGHAHCADGA